MVSEVEEQRDLNVIYDPLYWNLSHQVYPQLYAPHFTYSQLDENYLSHLKNISAIHSAYRGNKTDNLSEDGIFNYDDCNGSQDSAWYSTEFQAAVHFMYITILLIAIFGNGIVCFIVCTSSRMQTVTNYFIANLALSDMVMAFFCIPFSFLSLFVLQ